MYNFIIEYIGKQLEIDFTNLITIKTYKFDSTNSTNSTLYESLPKISLCAKWLVSSSTCIDSCLIFNDKTFIGNFCTQNAKLIIKMNKSQF